MSATTRPEIMGRRHMVSAGHYLAAGAAFQILEAGGNAIDAGVAGGLAIGILESDLVSCGGVAPIIVYVAETQQVVTISGLGIWPKKADITYFQRHHNGKIPGGLMRTVVPAAPDAWLTALERYGTMSFADCARAAIRFAREGFPMYPLMAEILHEKQETYRRFPDTAKIFLPNDRPPQIGDIFVQSEAAASLQYMADEETAAAKRGGRAAGLQAARSAFYEGDIAKKIHDYHAANGGWMTREDMASFRVGIEPPVKTRFGDVDVYGCGPWCQGPALLQVLNILEGYDLVGMKHNSPDYIHAVTEAVKLVMADREAYYADPRFLDVPMDALLDKTYAAERRAMIGDRAWPEMPPAGPKSRLGVPDSWPTPKPPVPTERKAGMALDTSYLCVVDDKGNVFSATPSDGSHNGTVVPGVGIAISGRGSQSWTDPSHPSALAPGKRPRLTPNPAIAIRGNEFVPFGTPGGDVQTQAMTQTFLNKFVWNMAPQAAVDAPRFASYSFPSSFEPHDYYPALLKLESRIDKATGDALAAKGHDVEWWPDMIWLAGSICMIHADRDKGVVTGGADPRREGYAVGA
jgi:gamma-glutamyltranspeptidase/glutathione hydrolase